MTCFSKIEEEAPFVEECTMEGETGNMCGEDSAVEPEEVYKKGPRLHAQRKRPHHEPHDPHVVEANEERACTVVLPPFGEGRLFPDFQTFRTEHKTFATAHFTDFRVRTSETAETANTKLELAREKAGKPRDEAFLQSLIPFNYKTVTLRCKRGLRQKSRAKAPGTSSSSKAAAQPVKGRVKKKAKAISRMKSMKPSNSQRRVLRSKCTDCEARICGTAVQDLVTGAWSVVTSNEVVAHNHRCSQQTIDALAKSALLEREDILDDAAGMLMAGAQASNICDTIFVKYGIRITPKMLANIKRDRMGGKSAIDNLKLLLARFSTFSGTRCLIINDQLGNVCGVVMQSAAQREFFHRFGENLLLDWTHNTNNLGFYLGSLMVTSVSGHGVSVADFLCLDQTKAMMTAVTSWFKDNNPAAAHLVKSIVIDKDYTEWAVLREQFPDARVLLCQFHVIRWFGTVILQKKYNMGPRLRDDVQDILHDMVYARTVDAFAVLQERLKRLLEVASPMFLEYLRARWYNCRDMWSDCERGSVFTALNTTTNRIESAWNRIKKVLGKKLRIDLSVEAVFAYQTAVLAREYKSINEYTNQVVLRSEASPFIRTALSAVCDAAADAMAEEWNACVLHDTGLTGAYEAHPCSVTTDDDSPLPSYVIARPAADSATYVVDTNGWVCSCHSHITSGLPCRHMFFVARRKLNLARFPPEAVAPRWRVFEARDLLVPLTFWGAEMGSLRTGLLWASNSFATLLDPANFEDDSRSTYVSRRIAYYRLQRREESSVVVMNHLEKRGVLEAEFSAVTRFLISQSTPKFIELANQLQDVLRRLLVEWNGGSETDTDTSDGASEVDRSPEDDPQADLDELFEGVMRAGHHRTKKPKMQPLQQEAAAAGGDPVAPVPPSVFSTPPPPSPVSEQGDLGIQGLKAVVSDAADRDCESATPQPPSQFSTPTQPAHGKCVGDEDDLARGTETITTVGGPVPSTQLHELPFPAAGIADRVTQTPSQGSSVSSISTMTPSEISAYMTSVARYNIRAEPPVPVARSRNPVASYKLNGLRELLVVESDNDSDAGGTETLDGGISALTLPTRLAQGSTKKQKTSGKATGVREGYLCQESTCVVSVRELNHAMEYTQGIASLDSLFTRYPELLTESNLRRMDVTVKLETFHRASLHLNFSIPKALALKIEEAIVAFHKEQSLTSGNLIDFTNQSQTQVATMPVAHFLGGGSVRGFSSENLSDLLAFYMNRLSYESYEKDMQWLQTDGVATLPRIPYADAILAQRGCAEHSDISRGGRSSIMAVLSACALGTRFRIRTHQQQLAMEIRVADVLGFCGRSAKLNDSALMYALKQMASDYEDVYVFDCVGTVPTPPYFPPTSVRCIILPVNYGNAHWCLITLMLHDGVVQDVAMYDPMQGAYNTSMKRSWTSVYQPMIRSWYAKSGLQFDETHTPRFVELVPQFDYTSCGVFCVGIAYDFMSRTNHFQRAGKLSESDGCQLRVRMLWRIFCDSIRIDDEHNEMEAVQIVRRFEAYDALRLPISQGKLRDSLKTRLKHKLADK